MAKFISSIPEKFIYFFSMLLSRVINRNKNLKTIPVRNIVCIRQDEIGDMCYTTHVFKMLALQYPHAHISLLCKPFVAPLVKNDPNIHFVCTELKALDRKYDLIIDLRGSWTTIRWALLQWPAIRLDRGSVRYSNMKKGKHPHEVITNMQVVEPLIDETNLVTEPAIYHHPEAVRKVDDFLATHQIKRFAVLHPGARKVLRKWDKFDQLAAWITRQKQLDVIVTGDASEVKEIEVLQGRTGQKTFSVAGLFDLGELSVLLSRADVYIGNESGPLHIACVCGTPSLGLFGPGEPHVFYPRGKKTDYIHHLLECNPCDQIHCVHPENPCIQRIQLPEVTEKVEKLLQ